MRISVPDVEKQLVSGAVRGGVVKVVDGIATFVFREIVDKAGVGPFGFGLFQVDCGFVVADFEQSVFVFLLELELLVRNYGAVADCDSTGLH